MAGQQFQNYLDVLNNPDFNGEDFPSYILNDINLMYSYTEEEFQVKGVPVIENMFYNVAYTKVGSREFEPTFGSDLLVMVHELNILPNLEIINMELFRAYKQWVPYANIMFKQTYCIGNPDGYSVDAYINYVDIFHNIPRSFILNISADQIG